MTLSRTLSNRLAPRFSGADRALARSGDASFEVVVADRFLLRLRGLAGLDEADMVPLLFPRCRSLHTFRMRAPIDVVWLELGNDGAGTVLAVNEALPPRRTVRAPRGSGRQLVAALELTAGDSPTLGLTPGANILITNAG